MVKTVDKCRLCDSPEISEIWNFGESPIANDYRTTSDCKSYPLVYFKCNNCHSVQLKYEVSPEILFKDYLYETPPNMLSHFREMSETTSKFLDIKPDDLIFDIGSNNGLLLKEYKKLGYKIFGIEPAPMICSKARENGVPTYNDFFDKKSSKDIKSYLAPKLITCTNCFAHVPNLNEFIESLKIIMDKDSYFVFENAYLLNTINNKDFGQAYFEHIFMHSIIPLETFFNKHGLELFKIEYNNVQMGSIRGYVRWKENKQIKEDNSVTLAILDEKILDFDKVITYTKFLKDINEIKRTLIQKIIEAKENNKSISVYAWPAKMTLINKYFGLEKYIDYIVEESSLKIGNLAPGTNLEIKKINFFRNNPTDCCIIGAYNFENDIKSKNEWYKGEWINPLNV